MATDLLAKASSSSSSLNLQIPPIAVKLDRDNFSLWHSTILSALETFGLESFALNPDPPAETILITAENKKATTEPNPAYQEWKQNDRFVLLWLRSTMSERALSLVARAKTTQAAWSIINKTFQSQTSANRMRLKNQLQSLEKGALSMMDYVEKKREIADTLAANLSPISDEDLINYILSGLDSTYGPFTTAFMMHKSDCITIDDLVGLLLQEESKLDRELQRQSALLPTPLPTPTISPGSTANAATRFHSSGRPSHSPRRSSPTGHRLHNNQWPRRYNAQSYTSSGSHTPTRFYNGQRQSYNDSRSTLICQICGRHNHEAIDCFQRNNQTDYPSRRPPPQGRQAHMVSYNPTSSVVDPTWYFDSGATDHVTPDPDNLTFTDDYTGTDKLQVGDGKNPTPRGHQ
ncbi:Retrovirus-related Pol polyprotein from transposon RE1 [Linum perenne]